MTEIRVQKNKRNRFPKSSFYGRRSSNNVNGSHSVVNVPVDVHLKYRP